MKITKFLEFHARSKKHNENLIIPYQHRENYGIHIIPRKNHENHAKKRLFERITKTIKFL